MISIYLLKLSSIQICMYKIRYLSGFKIELIVTTKIDVKF